MIATSIGCLSLAPMRVVAVGFEFDFAVDEESTTTIFDFSLRLPPPPKSRVFQFSEGRASWQSWLLGQQIASWHFV